MPQLIHGDIIEEKGKAFLFAIDGEADDTIYIPKSVVMEPTADEIELELSKLADEHGCLEGISILVKCWWFEDNSERFD